MTSLHEGENFNCMNLKITLLLLLTSISLLGQKSIQSHVMDLSNGMPMEMATVRLISPKDSSLIMGAQTDEKGGFILSNVKPGRYFLLISNVGYLDQRFNVEMERKDLILKTIQMKENAQDLKELDVKGTAAQLTVKGDTLEYNATAFKTEENAVVEDLLKRLPGVEISTDGKITVNGEEIKKIRVDGKKFFDGDMEMATKNLPAEMIEKIQVLEQKSDMAMLTGFEDDDTERIINLTTKSSRRKGVFGNVKGGAGADMLENLKYDANANINIMEGDAQSSIVGGANNVNNSRSGRGRRGFNGQRGGITSTENIGINNNTTLNPNLKLGGDASVNHSANFTETESSKETYLSGSTYNDSAYNRSNSNSLEANMRLEMEWKIDSTRTLIVQPNLNYNRSNGNSFKEYLYQTDMDTASYGFANNSSFGDSKSGGLRLIFSQKFKKPGRTLTFNLNSGFSQSKDETFNYSRKYTLSDTTRIDQYTTNTSDRLNFDFRASFVEPLWNLKNLIEFTGSFSGNSQNSHKLQYSTDDPNAYLRLDPAEYTDKVDAYSNEFANKFYRENLEVNYRYVDQFYNIMLGVKGEPSQTYSNTIYGDGSERIVSNEVFNFAPTGQLKYNFGKKKFVRFDYRGMTNQPSVSQMQPVRNNMDLMRETVGNASLNPAFNNNLRLMYSVFNDKTFSSFSTMMGANLTKDALVNNTIVDASGKQFSQTVNSEKTPLDYFGNIMFNTPIIQKRLHFNTNTNGGYNLRYGYSSKGIESELVDLENLMLGDLSITRSYNMTEQLSLTFTHDLIELGASARLRYSNSLNNLKNQVVETYDWTGRGNMVLRLPYNFTVSSDINYSNRAGYANFDQSELIWNASMDKTLFRNRAVVSMRWNDILQQQLNIRQTIGDNYISFNRYNTLGSYFMLSFSYKISQFKGGANENEFRRDRRFDRFGPGERPGGGRGGMSGGSMPGGGMFGGDL